MGYSPRDHKELDMTEWLTHTHMSIKNRLHASCYSR